MKRVALALLLFATPGDAQDISEQCDTLTQSVQGELKQASDSLLFGYGCSVAEIISRTKAESCQRTLDVIADALETRHPDRRLDVVACGYPEGTPRFAIKSRTGTWSSDP